MKRRIDNTLYNFGKWVWIPIVIIGIFYSLWGYDNLIHPRAFFMCSFKRLTGYPCPGCGGSRAVLELFRGHIISSVKYNAAVVLFAVEYLHFMGLCFARKNIFHDFENRQVRIEIYCYLLVAVLLLQWICRLVLGVSV